jgi:hypothetical protein
MMAIRPSAKRRYSERCKERKLIGAETFAVVGGLEGTGTRDLIKVWRNRELTIEGLTIKCSEKNQ